MGQENVPWGAQRQDFHCYKSSDTIPSVMGLGGAAITSELKATFCVL